MSALNGNRRPPRAWLVAWLAQKDLRHEPLLTLCLAGALAAVIAPLLVLFGLRAGVMEALRAELVEDPVFREVRPAQTMSYGEAFFKEMQAREDVAFITPNIARSASVVRATAASGATLAADMLPSGKGDTLLAAYALTAPEGDAVVLSQTAAQKLDARPGDTIELEASRTTAGTQERVKIAVRVAGVLPLRADTLERVYVPLLVSSQIESFREGFAVPARGWGGQVPSIAPGLDGVYVLTSKPLDAITKAELALNTGFFAANVGDATAFAARLGEPPPEGMVLLDLTTIERSAGADAIARVEERLAGRSYQLRPYVDKVKLALEEKGGAWKTYPLQMRDADAPFEANPRAWGEISDIAVPRASGLAEGSAVKARVATLDGEIEIPLRVTRLHDEGAIILSINLAGQLRRGLERTIRFDEASHALLLSQGGYRGFRLYARSIDDVPRLFRDLAAKGIETIAQVQAIERIQALDRGLAQLFWLIAAVGMGGAAIVLLASLYGSVERKTADLAHLRLLGLSRFKVSHFPVYQGIMVAGLGVTMGLAAALGMALLINSTFAGGLGFDRSICRIEPQAAGATIAATLFIAFFASLFAAYRTTTIDPSEAIRAE